MTHLDVPWWALWAIWALVVSPLFQPWLLVTGRGKGGKSARRRIERQERSMERDSKRLGLEWP